MQLVQYSFRFRSKFIRLKAWRYSRQWFDFNEQFRSGFAYAEYENLNSGPVSGREPYRGSDIAIFDDYITTGFAKLFALEQRIGREAGSPRCIALDEFKMQTNRNEMFDLTQHAIVASVLKRYSKSCVGEFPKDEAEMLELYYTLKDSFLHYTARPDANIGLIETIVENLNSIDDLKFLISKKDILKDFDKAFYTHVLRDLPRDNSILSQQISDRNLRYYQQLVFGLAENNKVDIYRLNLQGSDLLYLVNTFEPYLDVSAISNSLSMLEKVALVSNNATYIDQTYYYFGRLYGPLYTNGHVNYNVGKVQLVTNYESYSNLTITINNLINNRNANILRRFWEWLRGPEKDPFLAAVTQQFAKNKPLTDVNIPTLIRAYASRANLNVRPYTQTKITKILNELKLPLTTTSVEYLNSCSDAELNFLYQYKFSPAAQNWLVFLKDIGQFNNDNLNKYAALMVSLRSLANFDPVLWGRIYKSLNNPNLDEFLPRLSIFRHTIADLPANDNSLDAHLLQQINIFDHRDNIQLPASKLELTRLLTFLNKRDWSSFSNSLNTFFQNTDEAISDADWNGFFIALSKCLTAQGGEEVTVRLLPNMRYEEVRRIGPEIILCENISILIDKGLDFTTIYNIVKHQDSNQIISQLSHALLLFPTILNQEPQRTQNIIAFAINKPALLEHMHKDIKIRIEGLSCPQDALNTTPNKYQQVYQYFIEQNIEDNLRSRDKFEIWNQTADFLDPNVNNIIQSGTNVIAHLQYADHKTNLLYMMNRTAARLQGDVRLDSLPQFQQDTADIYKRILSAENAQRSEQDLLELFRAEIRPIAQAYGAQLEMQPAANSSGAVQTPLVVNYKSTAASLSTLAGSQGVHKLKGGALYSINKAKQCYLSEDNGNKLYKRYNSATKQYEQLTKAAIELELHNFSQAEQQEHNQLLEKHINELIENHDPILVKHFRTSPYLRKKLTQVTDSNFKTWFIACAEAVAADDEKHIRPEDRAKRDAELKYFCNWYKNAKNSSRNSSLIAKWIYEIRGDQAQALTTRFSFTKLWKRAARPEKISITSTSKPPGDLTWAQHFDRADGIDFCKNVRIAENKICRSSLLDSEIITTEGNYGEPRDAIYIAWCAAHDTPEYIETILQPGDEDRAKALAAAKKEVIITLGQCGGAYFDTIDKNSTSCARGIVERMAESMCLFHDFAPKAEHIQRKTIEQAEVLAKQVLLQPENSTLLPACKDEEDWVISAELWEIIKPQLIADVRTMFAINRIISTDDDEFIQKIVKDLDDDRVRQSNPIDFSESEVATLKSRLPAASSFTVSNN